MITAKAMTREVVILIADDDAGHARLIEKNLQRAGLHNSVLRFEDGQDIQKGVTVTCKQPRKDG
jgi:CheY-like chemotaxis protein